MTTSFGPWTSGIHTGSPQKMLLSSHWKQRLARLDPTRRNASAVSGHTWCLILGSGLLLGLVPAVHTVRAEVKERGDVDDKPAEKKVRPGLLYVRGFVHKRDKPVGMWFVTIDPKTGDWKALFKDANEVAAARLSPDRQTIAYFHDAKDEIWTRDAVRGESPGRVSKTGGVPCWSSDGKRLIATQSKPIPGKKRRWKEQTWTFNANGDQHAPVNLPEGTYVVDWSPDGRWLLAITKKHRHKLFSLDGKPGKDVPVRGEDMQFSPDGKRLAYRREFEGKVLVADLNGKNERVVFRTAELVKPWGLCWSPDGKSVAVALIDEQLDANGKKRLSAEPKDANFRIAIVDVKSGKHRILKLPAVKGVTFHPTDVHDWR